MMSCHDSSQKKRGANTSDDFSLMKDDALAERMDRSDYFFSAEKGNRFGKTWISVAMLYFIAGSPGNWTSM